MKENIYFDLCALILTVGILIIFYVSKNTPGKKNSVFRKIIWTLLISIVLNITVTQLQNYGYYMGAFSYLLKIVYYCVHTMISLLFCLYIIVFIDEYRFISKTTKAMLVLPVILIDLLVITTPITKLIFYYTSSGEYIRGSGFLLAYEVAIAYIIIALVYVLVNYKKYKKIVRYTLYIFLLFCIVPIVFHLFLPAYNVEHFTITIGTLILIMTLDGMENVVDANTGMFTQKALLEALDTYYTSKTAFDAVIIKNAELELIIDRMGLSLVNNLFRDVADYILEIVKPARSYFVNNECFVLIYPSGTADIEKNILEIQKRMAEPWFVGDLEMKISEYICRINVPRDALTIDIFMEYLNYIQNIKKAENKRLFVDDINLFDRKRRIMVEHALKNALENNNLQVFYQPIYSVESKQIVSAEALLRLEDPVLGFVSPEEFIPIAEKNGKIVKIGQIVFEKVCQFIAANNLKELGIEYVEVNLSVIQCVQADLVEEFKAIMEKYNIEPSEICLEITETATENVPQMLGSNIEEFKRMGMAFALDDYGTGYSNLQKMINLPFSYAKYDKEMIWLALSNERAYIAVENNVALMKKLGIQVVAEGVETIEQLEELIKMEFDYIQGYYFSKAIPEEKFVAYVIEFAQIDKDKHPGRDMIQDNFVY